MRQYDNGKEDMLEMSGSHFFSIVDSLRSISLSAASNRNADEYIWVVMTTPCCIQS